MKNLLVLFLTLFGMSACSAGNEVPPLENSEYSATILVKGNGNGRVAVDVGGVFNGAFALSGSTSDSITLAVPHQVGYRLWNKTHQGEFRATPVKGSGDIEGEVTVLLHTPFGSLILFERTFKFGVPTDTLIPTLTGIIDTPEVKVPATATLVIRNRSVGDGGGGHGVHSGGTYIISKSPSGIEWNTTVIPPYEQAETKVEIHHDAGDQFHIEVTQKDGYWFYPTVVTFDRLVKPGEECEMVIP